RSRRRTSPPRRHERPRLTSRQARRGIRRFHDGDPCGRGPGGRRPERLSGSEGGGPRALARTRRPHERRLMPTVSVQIGGTEVAGPVQLAALLTLVSLAPAMLVMLTGFVRIVIVLSFLRQAVGAQGMPPNQVVVSLALLLTGFVMMPVLRTI